VQKSVRAGFDIALANETQRKIQQAFTHQADTKFTQRVFDEVLSSLPKGTSTNPIYIQGNIVAQSSIWKELTEDERVDAYRRIAIEGWTGEEVIEAWKKQLAKEKNVK